MMSLALCPRVVSLATQRNGYDPRRQSVGVGRVQRKHRNDNNYCIEFPLFWLSRRGVVVVVMVVVVLFYHRHRHLAFLLLTGQ